MLTIYRLTPSLFECDHWRPDMFVFVKLRQTKCSTLKFFQFSEIILSESFSQWENFNHPQLISYNEISNPLWEFKLYNELMINKNRNTYNLCFYLFDQDVLLTFFWHCCDVYSWNKDKESVKLQTFLMLPINIECNVLAKTRPLPIN